ncbi:MAG: hypothetical protein WDN48_17150 [Pseudolabrys sp.]
MSAEEKSALGLTDKFANSLVQNYRTTQSLQNMFSGSSSSSLTSYA